MVSTSRRSGILGVLFGADTLGHATRINPTGPRNTPTAAWEALTADSGAGVAIISEQGVFVYANNEYARTYGRTDATAIIGRTVHQIFPAPNANERMGLIRNIVESGKPLVMRTIWRGLRLRATMRPVIGEGPAREVLVTLRAVRAADEPTTEETGLRVVDAVHVDLGRLASLTNRELCVLELIGSGLTLEGIATHLRRSRKTIENQRHSLGRKLGVRTRAELVRIAIECGLVTPGRPPIEPA